MTLSLSVFVNDRKLLPCVCHQLAPDLQALHRAALGDAGEGAPTSQLGIGYYEQGEVLLARRPLTRESSFEGLLCRSPSSCLLAHVTTRTKAGFRPVEAQPFRYKDWLWSQSGVMRERKGFDRRTLAIPSYLVGNIRTWQPAEVVFHLFLSFLHRTGTLGTLHWERQALRRALAAAVSLVGSVFEGPDGGPPDDYGIVATNGELVIGLGVGRPIAYHRVLGIEVCPVCSDRRGVAQARRQTVGHPHVKAALVTDRPPAGRSGWEVVSSGVVVEVDGGMGVEQGPLNG